MSGVVMGLVVLGVLGMLLFAPRNGGGRAGSSRGLPVPSYPGHRPPVSASGYVSSHQDNEALKLTFGERLRYGDGSADNRIGGRDLDPFTGSDRAEVKHFDLFDRKDLGNLDDERSQTAYH